MSAAHLAASPETLPSSPPHTGGLPRILNTLFVRLWALRCPLYTLPQKDADWGDSHFQSHRSGYGTVEIPKIG